jgi:hypothetical protein
MNIDSRNKIISLVLVIVIAYLSWVLVDAIKSPYRQQQEREFVTKRVRQRMYNVRDALIKYNLKYNKFPKTLDSVMVFIQKDSLLSAKADSLFPDLAPYTASLDSLLYSPRTGNKFLYVMVDSIRPNIYALRDPDSKDIIGDSLKTTLLNAASWE